MGVEIDGDPLAGNDAFWEVQRDGHSVGHLTRCAYSPRFELTIGLVNVGVVCIAEGTWLTLVTGSGSRNAVVVPTPWVSSETRMPDSFKI